MVISYSKSVNWFLYFSVFLYAFSFPFPRNISLIEVGIFFSITTFLFDSLKHLFFPKNVWHTVIFLFYLMFPLCVGIILQNDQVTLTQQSI